MRGSRMRGSTRDDARPRRIALPVLVAGAASSLLLAFSMTPTFSALTAAITNTVDTAGMGSLGMQETNSDGSVSCATTGSSTSASCSTINKYGGSMVMKAGDTVSTTVKVINIGTIPATSFTMKAGACSQSPVSGATITGTASDACGKYIVKVTANGTQVYNGTATAFAAATATDLLANATVTPNGVTTLVFSVTLDPTAGATYQGLMISQPITFTYGA